MSKLKRYSIQGLWKRCLAVLTAAVCLCCLAPAGVLAEQGAAQIGGLTVQSRREARVFQGTLDSTRTLTTWQFVGQEDVPYVSLREYVQLLFMDALNPVCDFAWEGDTFLVKRNGMNVAVDMANQQLSCADWQAFIGVHAEGALPCGIVEKEEFLAIRPSVKNESVQSEGKPFTLSLRDYGVELLKMEDDVLAPFAVAQAMFAVPAMRGWLAYNGDDYFDIVDSVDSVYGSEGMEYAPNPYADQWYSGSFAARTELSEPYAKYNYAAMCMLLDIAYGHKQEKGITSFDAYMSEQGIKEPLLTPDPKDDVEALTKLFGVLFDSGHDGEVLTRSIIDSEGAIQRADLLHRILKIFGFETMADVNQLLEKLLITAMKLFPIAPDAMAVEDGTMGPNVMKLMSEMMRMRTLKPFDCGSSRVDFSGDTCVIYFDGFKENLTRPESFYRKLPTKEDLDASTFAVFYDAFDQIKRNGNVKNVVIDLSDNGGGSAAALVAALGFLSEDGEVQLTYLDQLNQDYRSEWYHVDTNLDGRFDDQDGYGGQYNFYILTSGLSYSCANALPYFAQQRNQAKIIGEAPGGGDCVVAYYLDAYGHVGGISGFKQLGSMEGDAFVSNETAVTVDHPFPADEADGIYFHPEKIAEFITALTAAPAEAQPAEAQPAEALPAA